MYPQSEDMFSEFNWHVVMFFFSDGTITYRRQHLEPTGRGYDSGDLVDFQRRGGASELAVVLGCARTGPEALHAAQSYFREVARIDGVEEASQVNVYEVFGCDVSDSQFVLDMENGTQDILDDPQES